MEETDTVNKLLIKLNEITGSLSHNLKENIVNDSLREKIDEIKRDGELENNEVNSELEQAKLINMISYILVSLYFTNLKINGSKFNNESPIMLEIKRVKEYMDRVKRAQELLNKSEERDNKMEIESEKMVNKYLKEPAVSKVHFQDRNDQTESSKVNEHKRFNDNQYQTEERNKHITERENKKNKKDNNRKTKLKKLENGSKVKVKHGKINKPSKKN